MNDFVLNILTNCLNNDIKIFHGENGHVIEYGPSFEDLGDYLPTLVTFGKEQLWRKEVDRVIQFLSQNQYIYRDEGASFIKQFSRCYSQTDLVWGLILAAKYDRKYIDDIITPLEEISNNFLKGELNFLLLSHIPYTAYKLPKSLMLRLPISSSEDHGMYIEIYVKMYELTENIKYLEKAQKVADVLYSAPHFKKYGFLEFYKANNCWTKLLVNNLNQFSKREYEFQLLKQNSNALFGLYALSKHCKTYKATFDKALETWLAKFYDSKRNIFYTNFNVKSDEKGSDLTVFHIIELLILAEKTDVAKSIAYSFIAYQDKNTGLIPFLHPDSEQTLKRMNINDNESWLDSAIDFGVSIVRLYSLTKDEKLLDSAKRTLSGIEKYHKLDFGFAAKVSTINGKVLDDRYSAKMTALVSKLSIAIENLDSINDQSHHLYDLLQDR